MSGSKEHSVFLDPFDTIFGRVCLERGWATREEIIACLKSRLPSSPSEDRRPFLAERLVAQNVITPEQAKILREEVSRVLRSDAYGVVRKDDTSLGQILVTLGAATREQVAEALKVQEERSRKGEPVPRLGEILLEKGYVTFAGLQDALRRQEGTIRLRCPSCGARYAVTDHHPRRTYLCRRCTSPLSLSSHSTVIELPEPEEVARSATNPKNVLGKYVVVKELGRGGSGAVYKAWDRELKRWIALKVLMAAQDVEIVIRFRREAETAAALQHPSIVPIYDVGESGGRHFIVMKYIEGQTLADRKLDIRRACQMLAEVARAIDHAHQKDIIHRDLKPQNIMVDDRGHAYVMDFGLAKDLFGSFQITAPGTLMGTPSYMPPEQAEGHVNRIDKRSDVYSLGAILYGLLAGRPPFKADSLMETIRQVVQDPVVPPTSLRPEIPANLENILLKALAKEKASRHATAGELAEDLERHLTGEPVKVVTPAPEAKEKPPKRGGNLVFWIAVAVLVGIILILLGVLAGHSLACSTG